MKTWIVRMLAVLAMLSAAPAAAGDVVTEVQIAAGVGGVRKQIDRCALDASTAPKGELKLQWQIDASGVSSDVVVVVDTLQLPAATACIVAVVGGLRFPAAARGRSATSAFSFPREGGLSRQEIQRVIDPSMLAIKRCYDDALEIDPYSAGTVRFVWKIGGDGTVTEVNVDVDTMARPAATQCMRRVIAGLVFPRPVGGGVVGVTYPFVFSNVGVGPQAQPPPPPTTTPTPPTTTTTPTPTTLAWLSREDIERVVSPAMPRIKRCFYEATTLGSSAAGTVRLAWEVFDTGAVGRTVVEVDTLGLPAATDCIRTVVASLQFPQTSGARVVSVTWPFVFSSPAAPTPPKPTTTSAQPGCGWWRGGDATASPTRSAPPATPGSAATASAGAMQW